MQTNQPGSCKPSWALAEAVLVAGIKALINSLSDRRKRTVCSRCRCVGEAGEALDRDRRTARSSASTDTTEVASRERKQTAPDSPSRSCGNEPGESR